MACCSVFYTFLFTDISHLRAPSGPEVCPDKRGKGVIILVCILLFLFGRWGKRRQNGLFVIGAK